eukprot:scaffold38918_cov176-Amphora_coffeaeformis.AAC.2
MEIVAIILYWVLIARLVAGEDRFNYIATDWDTHNFGPADWSEVGCDDIAKCVSSQMEPGWPTNWAERSDYIPYYQGMPNTCLDCSESNSKECRDSPQSPIDLDTGITAIRECKDWHKMTFQTGNCRFNKMNFEILPHVLRAGQPETGCQINPCVDFSFGFAEEWLLRHTDISLPSQHTLNGKRFAGEVILTHVLGVNVSNKEIGNVSWLLEVGTEVDFYDFLELYIRRWRNVAKKTVRDCIKRRRMKENGNPLHAPPVRLLESLPLSETNYTEPEPMDVLSRPFFDCRQRKFHPYDWWDEAQTEYYFRYEGSLTEPPCVRTAHWRVMRRPIRVAPSQIRALEKLLAERIDPDTCEAYTAGRPRDGDTTAVDVNRPLQKYRHTHKLVYCECVDWKSRFRVDGEYCSFPMEVRGVSNFTN